MTKYRNITIDVGGHPLTCRLAEPEQLAESPALLLNFAGDRVMSLEDAPYDITPRMFTDAGHRALSFDLPLHGDRVVPDQPQEIESQLVLHVVPQSGHSLADEWRRRGGEYLLKRAGIYS